MGLFSKELSNVVEWNETNPNVLFYKWKNSEIKKGSRLIIRPGQDAIFLYNGVMEGIFTEEGSYDIESQIIPFLSTLKGFKFGFNSGLRAEVLFINTKEVVVKWGTKNAINLPAQGLPGGLPIRAFGSFCCRIADYHILIDKLAGVKTLYTVEDVKERIIASLDQLLMTWIGKEGHDMFNLQMDAANIAKGIESDLDMQMRSVGIAISAFRIESFSYPEEIKNMQVKAAAQSMVGDMNRYTQMAAADAMAKGGMSGSRVASDMVGMQMGMMMGQQMMNSVNQMNSNQGMQPAFQGNQGSAPKFCPNCGTPTNGANFCSNCGQKLV